MTGGLAQTAEEAQSLASAYLCKLDQGCSGSWPVPSFYVRGQCGHQLRAAIPRTYTDDLSLGIAEHGDIEAENSISKETLSTISKIAQQPPTHVCNRRRQNRALAMGNLPLCAHGCSALQRDCQDGRDGLDRLIAELIDTLGRLRDLDGDGYISVEDALRGEVMAFVGTKLMDLLCKSCQETDAHVCAEINWQRPLDICMYKVPRASKHSLLI